jgi:hypothetical protein
MKASIVVMSHLSDAQELTTTTSGVMANKHINFAKFIILRTNGNLTQEIDPDALWDEFNDKI